MAPQKPNPIKSTALSKAQAIFARINALLPSYSTPISPVTVYEPYPANNGTGENVGNLLLATNNPALTHATTTALWGVWIAPDLFSGASYTVQVEAVAGGGGGGGGSQVAGGGGAAGAEYCAEPTYTVQPGLPYIWVRGIGGQGGTASTVAGQSAGDAGGDTIFDITGTGLPSGVHAHGGNPGDSAGAGVGGVGNTGTSTNTIQESGGNGGTNLAGVASDNPVTFEANSSLWITEPSQSIPMWLIMDDAPHGPTAQITSGDVLNNAPNTSGYNGGTSQIQNYNGGLYSALPPAPPQAPTGPNTNFVQGPNPAQTGGAMQFKLGNPSQPSCRVTCDVFSYAGTKLVTSGWIQCDPSGVWGSLNNANATIATNCEYVAGKAGTALYFNNSGTAGNPVWNLSWYCSNGTTTKTITSILAATPGQWHYVVGIFNNGTTTLYVDNVQVNTASAGFSSVVGGAYPMTIGMRPDSNLAWYFGYMSNFWFAQGVPNTTLLANAFGTVITSGGAGGGATGSPGGVGGNGAPGVTTAAGAGGTAAALPVSVAQITTAGEPGGAGTAQHFGNVGVIATQGSGAGGCGSSVLAPTLTTLTTPILTAATYNGVDGTQPSVPYNPTQQGTQGTLVAGGQLSDPTTGTKNSLLILPPKIASSLVGQTITNCYLTVYNSNPTNAATPVLEINYSNASALPASYTPGVTDTVAQVCPFVLQNVTAAQQINLMNTPFVAALQSSAATALVLGPGGQITSSVTNFDAYNAPAATAFFASIYGPGATDAFGNSLAPTLTVVYCPTAGTLLGATGGSGLIAVTLVNNSAIPVATIEPFVTADAAGNQLASGFTGPISAWQPGITYPTPYIAETWHSLVPYLNSAHWQVATLSDFAGFRLTAQGDLQLCGLVECTNSSTGVGNLTSVALPAGYFNSLLAPPAITCSCAVYNASSVSSIASPSISLLPSGILTFLIPVSGTFAAKSGSPGTEVSLDGVVFPISAAAILG